MSAIYTVKPLDDFTIFNTPQRERVKAPWSATWQRTLTDLGRELSHLEAGDVVMELDVRPNKVRRDGMLYADAKVGRPGVRMSFESKHGPMSYTSDRYLPDWQANVRAIVLTLSALRAVDRYGATQGEQYAGFAALPPGAGATAMGGMARGEATEVIETHGGFDPDLSRSYRRARAMAHPDRCSGDRSAWDLVEQAARVLGLDQ